MRKHAELCLLSCYYHIKPLIPRRLQLKARRWLVRQKRNKYESVWPIDEKAAASPSNWPGWPNGKRFALVLTHDVDTAKGLERCDQLAKLEGDLGLRSSFNLVCEGYPVPAELRSNLTGRGFEVGIHGLKHDGNPFRSRSLFTKQAARINQYLKEWGSVGFRCPSMYHDLDRIGELNIKYDSSTFDTDPFEPQPDGVRTIFPFRISINSGHTGYVELPYTLPQDFTLFILMKQTNIDIWKYKLDWIAGAGGMALLNCHPDYMNFGDKRLGLEEYPVGYYIELLQYVLYKYRDEYWHVPPHVMAEFVHRGYRDPESNSLGNSWNTTALQSPAR